MTETVRAGPLAELAVPGRQYDNEAVRAVHGVVRDVLVRGDFRGPSPVPGQPPTNMVVLDD
ncbi:hypothetical protein [Streptomyces sp. SP17KL33]|uniref:hypothetical protein n=1 Tax=Streptomyces sp. SP17KL33 TaxID=3002534 RepID=UPI002E76BADC|nr:hypothetical protein [Streptomyces sp. SP17KL33]MEE1833908.1 hypothetical protein [Streptomyces sp. SP17KL33]